MIDPGFAAVTLQTLAPYLPYLLTLITLAVSTLCAYAARYLHHATEQIKDARLRVAFLGVESTAASALEKVKLPDATPVERVAATAVHDLAADVAGESARAPAPNPAAAVPPVAVSPADSTKGV